MPLIMDNDQYMDDMDDLFGDTEPAVQLPLVPATKGLFQRLSELSKTACCQYVTSLLYSVRNYYSLCRFWVLELLLRTVQENRVVQEWVHSVHIPRRSSRQDADLLQKLFERNLEAKPVTRHLSICARR